MQKIIAIVSTQMQLVNCIEYFMKLDRRDVDLSLLICAGSALRKKLMNDILSIPIYQGVFNHIDYVFYGEDKVSIVVSKYKMKRFFSHKKYDTIIIGNYLSIYHRYCQFICWKQNPQIKFVLVDDGTATSEVVILRNKEKELNKLQHFLFSKFIEFVYLGLTPSFKYFVPQSVLFFSVFDKLRFHKDDSFRRCDYAFLRNTYSSCEGEIDYGESIIIAGQPLVKEGIISQLRYNQILDYCISHYLRGDNTKIYYIPHPVEDVNDSLTTGLLTKVHVMKLNVPFEMWAIGRCIKQIVGFSSSVFVNLHYMCPDIELICFYPSEIRETKGLYLQDHRNTYSSFADMGIRIIII